MCGIIGYIGSRPARPLLVQGLERLEYRGYDSAGIALLEPDGLEYLRAVGNLQNLKQAAEQERLRGARPDVSDDPAHSSTPSSRLATGSA